MAKNKSVRWVDFYYVTDLLNQLDKRLPPGKFTVVLDYPFDTEHRFCISSKYGMTSHVLATRVAKEFGNLFLAKKNRKLLKSLAPSHGIEDLSICGFKVCLQKNVIKVLVGS